MDKYEFVIMIVSIVLFFGLFREFVRRRHGSARAWDQWLEDSGLEIGEEKFEVLERRVEVLERIATDKKRTLSEEIENL